jgi:predicted metal-dependent hydrolase
MSREAPEYRRAIALFNAGDYFAAHEWWEALWRRSTGTERHFYQGLIQAAVALHHFRRGNRRAAQRIAERALAHLANVPTPFHGLDVAAFAAQLRRFFERPTHAPVPRLVLEGSDATGRT